MEPLSVVREGGSLTLPPRGVDVDFYRRNSSVPAVRICLLCRLMPHLTSSTMAIWDLELASKLQNNLFALGKPPVAL